MASYDDDDNLEYHEYEVINEGIQCLGGTVVVRGCAVGPGAKVTVNTDRGRNEQ